MPPAPSRRVPHRSTELYTPRLSRLSRRCAALPRPLLLSKASRSEEHTSELQSQSNLVCRLLLEKKKTTQRDHVNLSQAINGHTVIGRYLRPSSDDYDETSSTLVTCVGLSV